MMTTDEARQNIAEMEAHTPPNAMKRLLELAPEVYSRRLAEM